MKFIILSILLQLAAFSQTPEKDFLEISPEQEKKIQEREQKKKEAFYRKQLEEKKKIEELKKQLEEKKKIEEAQKLAAEKEAREEKIAAEARAAEEKKLAAEKKKRDEVEAYTKWLLSERDRKMKEASKSSGASGSAGSSGSIGSSGSAGSSGSSGSGANSQAGTQSGSAQKNNIKSIYRTKYFHYTENDINGKSLFCRKTPLARNWEQTFRDKVLSRTTEKLNDYFERSLQTFICNCRFAKAPIIPSDLKIVAMAGHEAAIKGSGVYRNSILGNVSVNIKEKGNVALILNTYESTKWTIHSGEANIIAVVILGHHLQEVLMDTVAPVLLSSLNNNDPCDKYGVRISHHFKNVLEREDEASPAEEIQSIRRVNEISLLLFGKTPEAVPYRRIFDPEISLSGR